MYYHVIYEMNVDDIYIIESLCENASDISFSCEILFTGTEEECIAWMKS